VVLERQRGGWQVFKINVSFALHSFRQSSTGLFMSFFLKLYALLFLPFYSDRTPLPDDVLNVIDENKWKESPTLGEYLILYPDCKTERGIRCVHCGSGSLRNWGVLSERDERRVFVCNHCGQRLYRSSV
jgi:DNA-directed RNA polymerase subunit RPC12/RpoP